MSDANAAVHSSAAEVTAALLALNGEGRKFTVSVDRQGRIEASWFLATTGSTNKYTRYRITLLDESGEYQHRLYDLEEVNTQPTGSLINTYSYSFNSSDLTGPVDEVLAKHGWTRRRSGVGKFFGGLFGRG